MLMSPRIISTLTIVSLKIKCPTCKAIFPYDCLIFILLSNISILLPLVFFLIKLNRWLECINRDVLCTYCSCREEQQKNHIAV